jgi:hypothetical protein
MGGMKPIRADIPVARRNAVPATELCSKFSIAS